MLNILVFAGQIVLALLFIGTAFGLFGFCWVMTTGGVANERLMQDGLASEKFDAKARLDKRPSTVERVRLR
jgi:hypothetical protein